MVLYYVHKDVELTKSKTVVGVTTKESLEQC